MRCFSVPSTSCGFSLNLVITAACAKKKIKIKQKFLHQSRLQLLHHKEEKPSSFALGLKIFALGKITELMYVGVRGEFLVILNGMTSRELGMPEICPASLLKCMKPQYIHTEHSRAGTRVLFIIS